MRWYVDNSDLIGIRSTDIPDILLFGGVVVSSNAERGLQRDIETVKKGFGGDRLPVKWNFKNLEREYKKYKLENQYKQLLATSGEWRKEIFAEAIKHEFKVIISCVETHSVKKEIIKDKKSALSGFVFANGLMRLGLYAREVKAENVQVLSDWPDKHDSEPFVREYSAAYANGKSSSKQKYYCGPLRDIGFTDSVAYTTMTNSTLLQFADLVVGATREVIMCALGKKDGGLGLDLSRVLRNHYMGGPENVFGRGINVGSGSAELASTVRTYLKNSF